MNELFDFFKDWRQKEDWVFSWSPTGYDREGNVLVDATDAWSVRLPNFDITSITPFHTVLVSDKVVWTSDWVNTISNSNNIVVYVCSTLGACDYARFVIVKNWLIRLNSNWNRLLSNRSFDGICVLQNVCCWKNVYNSRTFNIFAVAGDV